MTTHEEFVKLLNYKPNNNETICSKKITSYIEEKYEVKIYRCIFEYDACRMMNYIFVYLNTTEDLNKIPNNLKNISFCNASEHFQNIINESGIEFKKSLWIMFRSFELEAVCECYRDAFSNYWPFKAQYFNEETMDNIWNTAMFVIYKDENKLKQAVECGETQKMENDYYEYIKEYDKFGFVTKKKNLLIHFDYKRNNRNDTAYYYELYWDILEQKNLLLKETWR